MNELRVVTNGNNIEHDAMLLMLHGHSTVPCSVTAVTHSLSTLTDAPRLHDT